jgi:hypothetical protein
MPQYLGDTQSRDFHIARAIIKSPAANLDLDVAAIVSEINVYEHIDKPYITGSILLVDTGGLFDGVNFQGGEVFELELTRSVESELKPVTKTFILYTSPKISDSLLTSSISIKRSQGNRMKSLKRSLMSS